MNAAYKWYSYNSNIIQFYSVDYNKGQKAKIDCIEETDEQSSEYVSSIDNSYRLM